MSLQIGAYVVERARGRPRVARGAQGAGTRGPKVTQTLPVVVDLVGWRLRRGSLRLNPAATAPAGNEIHERTHHHHRQHNNECDERNRQRDDPLCQCFSLRRRPTSRKVRPVIGGVGPSSLDAPPEARVRLTRRLEAGRMRLTHRLALIGEVRGLVIQGADGRHVPGRGRFRVAWRDAASRDVRELHHQDLALLPAALGNESAHVIRRFLRRAPPKHAANLTLGELMPKVRGRQDQAVSVLKLRPKEVDLLLDVKTGLVGRVDVGFVGEGIDRAVAQEKDLRGHDLSDVDDAVDDDGPRGANDGRRLARIGRHSDAV